MALIHIHKIMIGTALAFCTLFAVRCMMLGETALGLTFAGISLALGVYFWWFLAVKSGSLSDSRARDNTE